MPHKKYQTWEDISDMLTPEGMKAVKVGQILLFENATLKIMHKTAKKVWAKQIKTYTPDEFKEDQALNNKTSKD